VGAGAGARVLRQPAPDELAARHGDADGLGVYMGLESVRYLLLDRYRG
jgi:hypothetical protein